MPLYEFKCDECKAEREAILPFGEANTEQQCTCGHVMRRRFSLFSFTMPFTGRDKVLATLNKDEGGYGFPGGDKHRPRYEQVMGKSLDYVRPLEERIFTGF